MIEQSWNQVSVCDCAQPDGWMEAPANGWGALVTWTAGPANTYREPVTVGERHTEVLVVANGAEVHQPSALSDIQLESVEDDIDSYLAAASIPAVPRGYAWFIRRPLMCRTEAAFWAAVTHGVKKLAPEAEHPLELRLVLDGVLRSLYA